MNRFLTGSLAGLCLAMAGTAHAAPAQGGAQNAVQNAAQNAAQQPPPGFGRSASFSGTKIVVADLDKALAFYSGMLGMKEVTRYGRPDLQEIMLAYEGQQVPQLVLVHYPANPKIVIGNGYGYLVFVTPDVRGLFARLKTAGYKTVQDPHEMTDLGIIVGFAEDHEGRPIELVEMMAK
jgi:catechol 2,3-dioxygenase-like lactoylglutathione lyase family enzyme